MHTHTHQQPLQIVTHELPFSLPMVMGLFCLTILGATAYAITTQPRERGEHSALSVPVTPEVAARTSFAQAIADSIPLAFAGTLISLTDAHAMIEYTEESAHSFINPATGANESIHRSMYVVARTDAETVFLDPIDTLTPGTPVSVHLRPTTQSEHTVETEMYILTQIQLAPISADA